MSTMLMDGPRTWTLTQEKDGHRTYKVKFLVISDDEEDGPQTILQTEGLPIPGNYWQIGNDLDVWAWCAREASVTQVEMTELQWEVEYTFSTKVIDRCVDTGVEDPLSEPPKLSGGYKQTKEEAWIDRFGNRILNSAFEMIRGPQVEFDTAMPTIRIVQNVYPLNLAVLNSYCDCVNAYPLWGLPPRTIKLTNISWTQKFYGFCNIYYERTLEFEVNYRTWDKTLLDEGNKVLRGRWGARGTPEENNWLLVPIAGQPPNPNDPTHFIQFLDRQANATKVILNGRGVPAGVAVGNLNSYLAIMPNSSLNPVENPSQWVQLASSQDSWNQWSADPIYTLGDVVYITEPFAAIYVLVVASSINQYPPDNEDEWFVLGNGINDQGVWDATVQYNVGDSVRAPGAIQQAGSVFVSKYPGVDFLLLGVPSFWQ